jgi:hypothetical protein
MKPFVYFLHMLFFLAFFAGCGDDPEKDDQLPVIDMSGNNAFPQNCTTVYRGESFTFHAVFTDNAELGSFSIDIHHNFDHHTHSTDITDCELGPVKAPVNPFLLIEEQKITPGSTTYTANIEIDVPDDVDTGDYHFMVKLTDAEGWQALKGISFKIEDRPGQ